jgi:signal transduction histidine kinase
MSDDKRTQRSNTRARISRGQDALLERVGFGLYRTTPDGQFTDVNSVLLTMLGYPSEADVLSLNLARDVCVDGEFERLRSATNDGYGDWHVMRWRRFDDTSVSVRVATRAVVDELGVVEEWEGVVEDLTERRRHDELQRRAERMASIGTTLAGVAHELNNPLAAIIGFAQLLLKRPMSADDRTALEAIHHEAIRSATVVKDLLAITRKREVERRAAIDMNDVVRYIARTRRYALETAGIGCCLELDPDSPLVLGDRAQLEQVLLNLLSNAEHAILPQRGAHHGVPAAITVRTRHDAANVIIEVEDNGPGIPAHDQSRIWDAFWTTKDEGEGTGLGLSVAYGIIMEHEGAIALDNTSSSGARFVIHLPIAETSGGASTRDQAPRPLDVIVVDPEASDLTFVERFLTSRGHAVINAESAEAAIKFATQTAFDAVLCDAHLTDRDGTPVALSLRATSGCARARFVLSTPTRAGSEQLLAAFPDAKLTTRPYDIEELRRLVEGD